MYGLILIFSFYFIFYKFAYINSNIYLNLREHHSNSYLKKNKPRSLKDKIFYTCYKNSISKFFYWLNVVYCVAAVLGIVLGLIIWAADLESIDFMDPIITAILIIWVLLAQMSLIFWAWSGVLAKRKTYSPALRIIFVLFYVVATVWAILRWYEPIMGFFSSL